MSTPAWLDCSAGVAGNMLLGALLDAGADPGVVGAAVAAVHPALGVHTQPVFRHSIAATLASVVDARSGRPADAPPHPHDHPHDHDHPHPHDHDHPHPDSRPSAPPAAHAHRGWREVRDLLDAAELDAGVRRRAHAVFARLAAAEAGVHGTDPDDVHFHEVGALDAIGDIVGCAAALADLGLDGFVCSPVALGAGPQALGEHGRVPIPGPAVLRLLAGVPVTGGLAPMELTTPTGAALVAEYATAFGPLPPMTLARSGCGAGVRDPEEAANLTRILIGQPRPGAAADLPPEELAPVLLEAGVDDLDPRLWPGVLAALLAAGAVDAWLTPILMKKGRPAHQVSALVGPGERDAVLAALTAETTTLGVRELATTRHVLHRRMESVRVLGHDVRVKLGVASGRVVNVQPEFEDVAAAAAACGRPAKEVLAIAQAAARRFADPAD